MRCSCWPHTLLICPQAQYASINSINIQAPFIPTIQTLVLRSRIQLRLAVLALFVGCSSRLAVLAFFVGCSSRTAGLLTFALFFPCFLVLGSVHCTSGLGGDFNCNPFGAGVLPRNAAMFARLFFIMILSCFCVMRSSAGSLIAQSTRVLMKEGYRTCLCNPPQSQSMILICTLLAASSPAPGVQLPLAASCLLLVSLIMMLAGRTSPCTAWPPRHACSSCSEALHGARTASKSP
mmetsp:Transcript_1957/g.4326  ORF Transcript_1957/g.4326 Transcript_1957/m.4326 type:complete len:235 (+) Transcript_1957:95-799(+)